MRATTRRASVEMFSSAPHCAQRTGACPKCGRRSRGGRKAAVQAAPQWEGQVSRARVPVRDDGETLHEGPGRARYVMLWVRK